jgi:hypothetical protein
MNVIALPWKKETKDDAWLAKDAWMAWRWKQKIQHNTERERDIKTSCVVIWDLVGFGPRHAPLEGPVSPPTPYSIIPGDKS